MSAQNFLDQSRIPGKWRRRRALCLATMTCALWLAGTGAVAAEEACSTPRPPTEAPATFRDLQNPLEATAENLALGRQLYNDTARPIPCSQCHGVAGDGQGPLSERLRPRPTAFNCPGARSDGELFWVISEGSGEFAMRPGQTPPRIQRPGRRPRYTAMRGHGDTLSEREIWALVLYLRTFEP